MATFQYKAHHADQAPVEGRIEADDLKSAQQLLEDQGMVVLSIDQVEGEQAKTVTARPGPPPESEQTALQRQINRVLQTGKPLAPALLAYAQELPAGRRRLRLQHIAKQLEHGHDPNHELEAIQIDEEWIPLLSAGVSSGDPSQIPRGITDELQRAGDLRVQFASALAYPLLLMAVSLAILLLITWWITPTFQDIFADFEIALPAATQWLMTITDVIRGSRGLVIVIPALMLATLVAIFAIRPRSEFWDSILHHIPLFGSTVRLSDCARFTRYLADLMQAEVPVPDALRITGLNTSQAGLRREAGQLATAMDSADTDLLDSPSFCRNLPHTVVHALQFHAHPRAAALILRELSWMYDQQTRNRLAWISSLVEPVFIILLGTAVGFYVVALFVPLVSLISSLSG